MDQLESVAPHMPEVAMRRARHVVSENERLHLFVNASSGDSSLGAPALMGRLMVESHISLRDDYEVSCAELDFLVDRALRIEGVYGSRMTGGGFGGCTVTMMRAGTEERLREEIADAYRAKFQLGTPEIFPCRPSTGAGEFSS
jgi:galactokinase